MEYERKGSGANNGFPVALHLNVGKGSECLILLHSNPEFEAAGDLSHRCTFLKAE